MIKLLYYWARKRAFSLLLINLFTLCLPEGVEAVYRTHRGDAAHPGARHALPEGLYVQCPAEDDNEHPLIKGYATAVLDKVVIRRTVTKDSGGKEEGNIKLAVNGKPSLLYWSGKTHNRQDARLRYKPDTLLFAGEVNETSLLDLTASMVESDKDAAKRWGRAGAAVKGLSGLGGVIPVFGGAFTAGFKLLGSLAEFIGSLQDNDQEFAFSGSLNAFSGGIRKGTHTLIVQRRGYSTPDFEAHIDVQPYVVDPSWLELTPKRHKVRVILTDLRLPEKLRDYFAGSKDREVVLEFNVAGQSTERKFLANVFEGQRSFAIKGMPVYEGPWLDMMPMAMSLVSTTGDTKKKFQQVHGLLNQTAALVKAFTPKTKVDDTVFSVVDTVSGALIAGIAPSKKEVTYASTRQLINDLSPTGRSGSGGILEGTVSKNMKIYDSKGIPLDGDIVASLYANKIGDIPEEEDA